MLQRERQEYKTKKKPITMLNYSFKYADETEWAEDLGL
jgi:hypothetical protein